MAEKSYSNRELDAFFKEITAHLGKQDLFLERIETQTTKTNGRVNKLEWWKSAVIWGMSTICAGFILLSPLMWTGIKMAVQSTINDSLNKTLSKYNIEIN